MSIRNLAVLGAQWGDEGKGKIVDLLSPSFAVVARSQGGHNAGHTVLVNDDQFILHLIPSGILHPAVHCVIGNGAVIDIAALFKEIDELSERGITTDGRLFISDRAHVILPYHRDIEAAAETSLGANRIGTTSRGIGPSYEDKVGRRGLRIADLADRTDSSRFTEILKFNVERRNKVLTDETLDWRDVREELNGYWPRLSPFVADTSKLLYEMMRTGRPILFEGAQGAMLDIDHGTYPYVTSSNATIGGVCTGLGVGPGAINGVLGIAKAYTTRVGAGPFPTEVTGEVGDQLRQIGSEFGASPGRPRRCGWFDAVSMRYSARVNGIEGLAITKLDILDEFSEIQICSSYRVDGEVLSEPPANIDMFSRCHPVYETIRGWQGEGVTAGVRREDDLPSAARSYLDRVEELVGVPISIISTGSDRDDTIIRSESFVTGWLPSGSEQNSKATKQ